MAERIELMMVESHRSRASTDHATRRRVRCSTDSPHRKKVDQAIDLCHVHHGQVTLQAVIDQVPDVAITELSAAGLALVMDAIDQAFHRGVGAGEREVFNALGVKDWADLTTVNQ